MSLLPFLVIFNTTKVGFHSIKEVENLPKKLSQYQRKHFFHYSGNASHSKQDFSIRADSIQSISSLFYVFFRCHAILLLKTSTEVFRVVETHRKGKIAYPYFTLLIHQFTCSSQPDILHKCRRGKPRQ